MRGTVVSGTTRCVTSVGVVCVSGVECRAVGRVVSTVHRMIVHTNSPFVLSTSATVLC